MQPLSYPLAVQDFIPGSGSTGKEEEEEEAYSEPETVLSLGELSVVDLPEPEEAQDDTPKCESKGDQKLLLLAQQFIEARQLQEKNKIKNVEAPHVPRKIATPDPSKLPELKKQSTTPNPNVLPDFVS